LRLTPFKIVSKPSLVSTLFTKSIVSIIYRQSRKSRNAKSMGYTNNSAG
jgi:hypothetical protein